ncbi:MAG: hydrogenase maturation protease [Deltaproteobacteria bacterium]|nr:hydrogenase maturation protease [Deltaproteobacteria bacterium]
MKYLIGVGNYSMYDDSIGLRVVEHIARQGASPDFTVVDLSANILNLLFYFEQDTEKILIVDCLKTGQTLNQKVGDSIFFDVNDIVTHKDDRHLSTHEGDVIKVVELARQVGHTIPPLFCMGILPAEIKPAFGLSKALSSSLSEYCEQATHYLLNTDAGASQGSLQGVMPRCETRTP